MSETFPTEIFYQINSHSILAIKRFFDELQQHSSYLFRRSNKALNADVSNYFVNLNLDQIINEIAFSFADYNFEKYFYFSLSNIDSIYFRHEVFNDSENESIYENKILFTMLT